MSDNNGDSMSDRDTSINDETEQVTPPNYVPQRGNKRSRDSPGTELANFKEEMQKMIKNLMVSQQNELKIITPTLLEIKESNSNIEKSISFLAAQNEELKKKVEKLENDRQSDRDYINLLEDKIEDMLRDSRKKNILIKDAPKIAEETRNDLVTMVVNLSESVGHKILPSDISDIYRIRGRQNEKPNSPIIVEMVSAIQRTEILLKCKEYNKSNTGSKLCAKHLGHSTLATPIYVSEHLTPKAARLRFLASDLARSKGYVYCWTSLGKVFVRKTKTSTIIPITSQQQVQRLFQEA